MKSIIRKELQIILKERGTFFWLIAMPIVLIFIYSSVLKTSDKITMLVPSYTVMFAFFIILTMVKGFFREKDSGMLARLQSTPMKPLSYLMGMWVSSILAVLIQCTVLFSFGHFVYDMKLGNISAVIFMILAIAICVTGIGLALSFLVVGENQGVAFTQLIALGGSALGGIWMPFDSLPDLAKNIGYFTPQYWAQKALINIMMHGYTLSNVWLSILVLLTFGAAGLLIALLRFKSFILSSAN